MKLKTVWRKSPRKHLEGQKDEKYKRTDKARPRLEWQVQRTSVRNSRRETKKNEREANIQRKND